MKYKVLIIVPRLPLISGSKRDKRLYTLMRILVKHCEVHLLFIQSMIERKKSQEELEKAGVKIISLRELKKRFLTWEDILKGLLLDTPYKTILFDNYFTAKYYLHYIETYSPGSTIVIDTERSQYLSAMKLARESQLPQVRKNALQRIEVYGMKEIPVYAHADTLLITHEAFEKKLAHDIPYIEIKVIPELTDDMIHDKEISNIIYEIFLRKHKNKTKKRTNAGTNGIVLKQNNTISSREFQPLSVHEIISYPSIDIEFSIVERDIHGTVVEHYNRGLKKVSRSYGLLLYDDTVLTEYTLPALLFSAQAHPTNGIVVPNSNLLIGNLVDINGLKEFALKHYVINYAFWSEIKHIPGSCILIKREVLDAVGVLDIRYATLRFALLDFCIRAFQHGYRTMCVHESFVYYQNPSTTETMFCTKDHELLVNKWCDSGIEFLETLRD